MKQEKKNHIIFYWLLVGMIMVVVQVMIGGITRITESGLSITEWEPIKGAMLPASEEEWKMAFDKYKNTNQFVHLKSRISIREFQFIFFWEWFHRNWARMIGVVFLLPFVFFLWKKYIPVRQSKKYWGLFSLGLFQALMGWIMVKSGLKDDNLFVEHTFLAIHFALATTTLCYIIYLIYQLRPKHVHITKAVKKNYTILSVLLAIQLVYGSFMSGLRAVTFAPTWPTINGDMIPTSIWKNIGVSNFLYNPFMVHFIHRTLAYIIFFFIIYILYSSFRERVRAVFQDAKIIFGLTILQIILGIITVLTSPDYVTMRWYAILHQMTGLILFSFVVWVCLNLKMSKKVSS